MKKSLFYSLFIISFFGIFPPSVLASPCEGLFSGTPLLAHQWITMKKRLINAKADPNKTYIPEIANQISSHIEHIRKIIELLPNKSERQRARDALARLKIESNLATAEQRVTYKWWIEFNYALLQLLNPPNVPSYTLGNAEQRVTYKRWIEFNYALLQLLNPPNVPSYTLGNKNKIIDAFPETIVLPVIHTREEIGGITAINKLHDNRIFPFRLPISTRLHEVNELAGIELRDLGPNQRTTHIDFFDPRPPKELTIPVPPSDPSSSSAFKLPISTRLHEVNELAGMSRELRDLDPQRTTHIDFFDPRPPKELTIPVPPSDPSSSSAFKLHNIAHRAFGAKEQEPIRTHTEEQEATRTQAQIIEQITRRAQSIPDRKKRESIELVFFILMHDLELYTRDFRTSADILQLARENLDTITSIYMEQIRQNLAAGRPATREEAKEAINDFIEIASQVE